MLKLKPVLKKDKSIIHRLNLKEVLACQNTRFILESIDLVQL